MTLRELIAEATKIMRGMAGVSERREKSLRESLFAAESREKALREALEAYGMHLSDCAIYRGEGMCRCGFAAALAAGKEGT